MVQFDRNEHVFHSPDFEEIVKDTIRFFNGTPVLSIPVPERFHGTGVYAIYCITKVGLYKDFHEINRTSYRVPIYIGKAVPKGWRQARTLSSEDELSYELHNRIREHGRSLDASELNRANFRCRFMILEGAESDLIGTVEAALIRNYLPLWNTLIDGFGNHDPGSGRYEQAKSDWDVCHPGRPWAERCQGKHNDKDELIEKINSFMKNLREKYSDA
ncbi:Eco29kI family restriction endonuclease [Myxococcota bacterium]|nr:Eco29kI family restriction endonuclease [Myxococcota bacterium]